MKAEPIVSRSRNAKRPSDAQPTGRAAAAPAAPNMRAKAASLATPADMFTAVTPKSFTPLCTAAPVHCRSHATSIELAVAYVAP